MVVERETGPLTDASVSAIVLYVQDLGAMLLVYRDVLELRVEIQTEDYVELRAGGGADMALHAAPEPKMPVRPDWFLEFRVKDIESVVKDLRGRGLNVGDIAERWWGREGAFTDPEGNQIEVEEPNREAQAPGPLP